MKLRMMFLLAVIVLMSACDSGKVEPEVELYEKIPDCISEERRNADYMTEIGIPNREGLARLLGLPAEKVKPLKDKKIFDVKDFSGDPENYSPDFIQRIENEYWVGQRYSGKIMILDKDLEIIRDLTLSEFGDSAEITSINKYGANYICSWVNNIDDQSSMEYKISIFSGSKEEKVINNYNILSFVVSKGKIYDPEQYRNVDCLFKIYDQELKEIGVAGENVFRTITSRDGKTPAGPFVIKNELKLLANDENITAHSVNFPWAAKLNLKTGETSLIKYQGEIFRIIENLYFDRLANGYRDAYALFRNFKEYQGNVYMRLGLPYRDVFILFDSEWKPREAWYCEVRCSLFGLRNFDLVNIDGDVVFMVVQNGPGQTSAFIKLLTE